MDNEKISDVKYAAQRISDFVDQVNVSRVSTLLDVSNQGVKDWINGRSHMKVGMVEKAGEVLFGITVSEMFLAPGVEVDWYHEASTKHFGKNFEFAVSNYCSDKGIKLQDFAKALGISMEALRRYRQGKIFPHLLKLQTMADALEIEVADLFLPW